MGRAAQLLLAFPEGEEYGEETSAEKRARILANTAALAAPVTTAGLLLSHAALLMLVAKEAQHNHVTPAIWVHHHHHSPDVMSRTVA